MLAPLDRRPEAEEKESKGGTASTQRQASKPGSEPVGLDEDEEAVKEEEGDVGESFDEAGDEDCIAVEAGKTPLAEIGTTKGEAVPEGPGSEDDASGDFESGSSEVDGEDAELLESGKEATEISVEEAHVPQGYKGNSPITGLVNSEPYNAVACIMSGLDFVNVDKREDPAIKEKQVDDMGKQGSHDPQDELSEPQFGGIMVQNSVPEESAEVVNALFPLSGTVSAKEGMLGPLDLGTEKEKRNTRTKNQRADFGGKIEDPIAVSGEGCKSEMVEVSRPDDVRDLSLGENKAEEGSDEVVPVKNAKDPSPKGRPHLAPPKGIEDKRVKIVPVQPENEIEEEDSDSEGSRRIEVVVEEEDCAREANEGVEDVGKAEITEGSENSATLVSVVAEFKAHDSPRLGHCDSLVDYVVKELSTKQVENNKGSLSYAQKVFVKKPQTNLSCWSTCRQPRGGVNRLMAKD
ncbi:hypothetical protein U1Q18_032666 [Sarracenia purpurea var. burkii]